MEIKFRFWTGKNMIYSDSYISLYYFFEIISNVDLQQFTGLKDKNGVEIYEGDILEFKNELGKHKIHKVFRVDGGLVINSHNDYINKEYNPFYEACADMQTSQWIKQCSVIGNIDNNPELLSTI